MIARIMSSSINMKKTAPSEHNVSTLPSVKDQKRDIYHDMHKVYICMLAPPTCTRKRPKRKALGRDRTDDHLLFDLSHSRCPKASILPLNYQGYDSLCLFDEGRCAERNYKAHQLGGWKSRFCNKEVDVSQGSTAKELG